MNSWDHLGLPPSSISTTSPWSDRLVFIISTLSQPLLVTPDREGADHLLWLLQQVQAFNGIRHANYMDLHHQELVRLIHLEGGYGNISPNRLAVLEEQATKHANAQLEPERVVEVGNFKYTPSTDEDYYLQEAPLIPPGFSTETDIPVGSQEFGELSLRV